MWSIFNIVPHKLVEILCTTPLQEDGEDDHEYVELSNMDDIFYDEDSGDREETQLLCNVIVMNSYQCDTSENIISVYDDGST